MRKVQVLLCVTVIFFCNEVCSQVTDFQLKDYKYRTPLYQSLQLNLDLTQSMSTNNEQVNTYDRSAFGAGIVGEIDYLRSVSTDALQSRMRLGAHTMSNFLNSKEGDLKRQNNYLSGGGSYSLDQRRYSGNRFFEFGASSSFSSSSKKIGTKEDYSTNKATELWANLYGGIGEGRLEYIHDAQTAMFILGDLYSEGIIRSKVDKETVNRFAQLITETKRRRVLDNRRRTIFLLTQIDSFMRSNRIVNNCDAKTMAIINDNLFYGFTNDLSGTLNLLAEQPDFDWTRHNYDEGFEGIDYGLIPQIEFNTDQMFRKHGTIKYARLAPDLYFSSSRDKTVKAGDDSVLKNHHTIFRPGLQLGYENHIAVNLNRQKYYKALLEFTYSKADAEFILGSNKSIRLSGVYGLGYYPNNRTVVEGEGMLSVNYSLGKQKESILTPGANIKTGYFISYNTVLRGMFRISTSTFTKSKQTLMDEYLRIYLLHYFF